VNVGVFSCDPGGQTGLKWGIYNPQAGDIGVQLKTPLHPGSATVSGSTREQIREIAEIWFSFFRTCVGVGQLPPEKCWFVCEDFIYAPGVNYEGDSGKISTAIIWGVEGYRMGRADEWRKRHKGAKLYIPPMVLQSASEAKSYATAARIKEWGCWVRGYAGKLEHEFSATQHIAFFLARHRQQFG
jgi:hypothetical protein